MNVIWSSSKASSKSTLKYIDEIFVHPARQHYSIIFILHQLISLRQKAYVQKQSGANDTKGNRLWQHGAECFFLHPSIMNSIQQSTFALTFDHHTYWYFARVFTDHIGNSHSCRYTHAQFLNTYSHHKLEKAAVLKIHPTKPIIALDYEFQQFV